MERIPIGQAQKLTSPNPFALLTVRKPDGKTNVMAVSWWSYASNHPASVVVCLSSKGYSGQCIRESGAFGLSVVGEELREAAMRAGTCSGRNMDKARELGIPLTGADEFPQAMVAGSRLWLSCQWTDSLTIGDHVLYVGEVTDILGDASVKGLYAWNGYDLLDTVPGE